MKSRTPQINGFREPSGLVPATFSKLHRISSTTLDPMNLSWESASSLLVSGVQMPAPMQSVGDGGKSTPTWDTAGTPTLSLTLQGFSKKKIERWYIIWQPSVCKMMVLGNTWQVRSVRKFHQSRWISENLVSLMRRSRTSSSKKCLPCAPKNTDGGWTGAAAALQVSLDLSDLSIQESPTLIP